MFDFDVSADSALLELDLSLINDDLNIHNSYSNPAHTIYLLGITENNNDFLWNGEIILDGEEAELIIVTDRNLKIANNHFKNFTKVLITDNLTIDNKNTAINYQIHLFNCSFNNLYLLNNEITIKQVNITDELQAAFYNDEGSLTINGNKEHYSIINKLSLSEDKKPKYLILNHVNIVKDFYFPKCHVTNINNVVLHNIKDSLELNGYDLQNFSNVSSENLLELILSAQKISFGVMKIPKGKILIAPTSYIQINSNSHGDFQGIELHIDLSKIDKNSPKNRELKFPHGNINFDVISINGASLIKTHGDISVKIFEIINSQQVVINKLSAGAMKYETDDGTLKLGINNGEVKIDKLLLIGKINTTFNSKTMIDECLHSFGQCHLSINRGFVAKDIFFNIDVPLLILGQNNNRWNDLYNREDIFGLEINNNGSNAELVKIQSVCGQITSFYIKGKVLIDNAILLPVAKNMNYFHIELDPRFPVIIKQFMASFFGKLFMDKKHGDVIFTHQSVNMINNHGPSSANYIVVQQGNKFPVNYSYVNNQEAQSFEEKYHYLLRKFKELSLRPATDLWQKISFKDADESTNHNLNEHIKDIVLYNENNDLTSYFIDKLNLAAKLFQKFIDANCSSDVTNHSAAKLFNLDKVNNDNDGVSQSNILSSNNYIDQLYNYLYLAKKLNLNQYTHNIFFVKDSLNNHKVGINFNFENPEKDFHLLGIIFSNNLKMQFNNNQGPKYELFDIEEKFILNQILSNKIIIDKKTGSIISDHLDLQNDRVILFKKQSNGEAALELLSVGFYNAIIYKLGLYNSPLIDNKVFSGILDYTKSDLSYNLLALSKLLISNSLSNTCFLPPEDNILQNRINIFNALSSWIIYGNNKVYNALINTEKDQKSISSKLELIISSEDKFFANQMDLKDKVKQYKISRSRSNIIKSNMVFYNELNDKMLFCINMPDNILEDVLEDSNIFNPNYFYMIGDKLSKSPNEVNSFSTKKFIAIQDSLTLLSSYGIKNLSLKIIERFNELQKNHKRENNLEIINRLIDEINHSKINLPLGNIKSSILSLSILKNIDPNNLDHISFKTSDALDYLKCLDPNPGDIHAKIIFLNQDEKIIFNRTSSKNVANHIQNNPLISFDEKDSFLSHNINIYNHNLKDHSVISCVRNEIVWIQKNLSIDHVLNNNNDVPHIPLIVCNDGFFYVMTRNGFKILGSSIKDNQIYLSIPFGTDIVYIPNNADNFVVIDNKENQQIAFNLTEYNCEIEDLHVSNLVSITSKDKLDNLVFSVNANKNLKQCTNESVQIFKPAKWLYEFYNKDSIRMDLQAYYEKASNIKNLNYDIIFDIMEAILESKSYKYKNHQKFRIYDLCKAFILVKDLDHKVIDKFYLTRNNCNYEEETQINLQEKFNVFCKLILESVRSSAIDYVKLGNAQELLKSFGKDELISVIKNIEKSNDSNNDFGRVSSIIMSKYYNDLNQSTTNIKEQDKRISDIMSNLYPKMTNNYINKISQALQNLDCQYHNQAINKLCYKTYIELLTKQNNNEYNILINLAKSQLKKGATENFGQYFKNIVFQNRNNSYVNLLKSEPIIKIIAEVDFLYLLYSQN